MDGLSVTYKDHFGSDLSVVNDARVSMDAESDWIVDPDTGKNVLSERDKGLIGFLARGMMRKEWDAALEELVRATDRETVERIVKYLRRVPTHWTPFGHCVIKLEMSAPVPIRTQCFKHKVGLVENEISRRYVDEPPEFFMPEVWRKRGDSIKQGSSTTENVLWLIEPYDHPDFGPVEGITVTSAVDAFHTYALDLYNGLIAAGVCAEQARFVLPQSMLTKWRWTGSLYAFAEFYRKRADAHAQKETQYLAEELAKIIEPLFPVSWKALTQ